MSAQLLDGKLMSEELRVRIAERVAALKERGVQPGLAAASCLLFYAALSIGHSFPNHKLLLSVAFYFGIQFGMQFVFGALTLLLSTLEPLPMFASFDEASIYIHVVMLALTLGTALVGALFYFLCTYFLKNRINLD